MTSAPPGPATLTVQNSAGQVATEQIYLNTVAPGIFLGSDGTHLAPDVSVKAGEYPSLFFTGQGAFGKYTWPSSAF
jgi:hypothetical protein